MNGRCPRKRSEPCDTLQPVFLDERKRDNDTPHDMNQLADKFLSKKNIPRRERLILALDVPSLLMRPRNFRYISRRFCWLFYKLGLPAIPWLAVIVIWLTGGAQDQKKGSIR